MSRTNSVYQQLRSHLAYLELGAAIEALLVVETDATEQRRHNTRMRLASLPAPWTINNFDFTA